MQEITYPNIEKETGRIRELKGDGGWLGFTDKYWGSAIIPDQSEPIDARFSASGTTQPEDYQTDFVGPAIAVAPGATGSAMARVFAGAKEVATIDAYGKDLGIKKFDLMIDWGWFYFITKPLFRLIDIIYRYVGNFGVAILVVTVLIKLAFFPLANQSYRSMAKMKKIQPQIAALKDLYPDDRAKQQQAQMELFKKEGVNPVAGCLPMVIQIPVFFALYKVIFITIEMRHAPFFGWIKDLSAPDPTNLFTLFGLIPLDPTVLPMFGHFLHLGIWPLIMGVSMFLQMKMNPEPADPVQKTMFAWMPVIFTFMLGSFPAGLVIYWTWNNTLTVFQQSLHHVARRREGRAVRQPQAAGAPRRSRRDRRPRRRLRAGDDRGGAQAVRRPVRFLLRRGQVRRPAADRRAGDRLRRPLQRRQVVADQRADRPHDAGAHVEHARADAGADLLRPRRPADPGRHAGLRLRRGRQGEIRHLGRPHPRLSARPPVADARLRAGRRTARRSRTATKRR